MTEESQNSGLPEGDSVEKAEQMIWKYLDQMLPEEQVPELETLLQGDEKAVKLYTDCVKLHVDLLEHFQEPKQANTPFTPDSPVLGSLGGGLPGVDAGPPVPEN